MSAFSLIKLPDRYPNLQNSPFANRKIVARDLYIMQADLTLASGAALTTFPDSSFLHNESLPLEVLEMVPFVDPLNSSSDPLSDTGVEINFMSLFRFVTLTIGYRGKSRNMTKTASRLSAMVQKDTLTLPFYNPVYLERSEGFTVAVEHDVPSASAAGGIRMEIGFLCNMLTVE